MLEDETWEQAALRALNDTSRKDEPIFERPEKATLSASIFFSDLMSTTEVLLLLTSLTVFADNASAVAKKIVDGQSQLPSKFDPFEPLEAAPGPFRRRLVTIQEPVAQMVLTRMVDNFTSYLADIIRECLTTKPAIMRSKETLTYEAILQYETMGELREAMVDRKVDELAYLGFDRLSEWLSERLGVAGLANLPPRKKLVELLEVRNCIVHNRGLASAKFYKAVGKPNLTLGPVPILVDSDLIFLAARASAEFVRFLDEALATKFALVRNTRRA